MKITREIVERAARSIGPADADMAIVIYDELHDEYGFSAKDVLAFVNEMDAKLESAYKTIRALVGQ